MGAAIAQMTSSATRLAAMSLDELTNECKRLGAQFSANYDNMTGFEKDGIISRLDDLSWAALMRALSANANWQIANDGTLDTILHCTNCGHEVRFPATLGGDSLDGARLRAVEFVIAGRCEGLDDFEKDERASDMAYDEPYFGMTHAERRAAIYDCERERAMDATLGRTHTAALVNPVSAAVNERRDVLALGRFIAGNPH